jgi:hypothetical protein
MVLIVELVTAIAVPLIAIVPVAALVILACELIKKRKSCEPPATICIVAEVVAVTDVEVSKPAVAASCTSKVWPLGGSGIVLALLLA